MWKQNYGWVIAVWLLHISVQCQQDGNQNSYQTSDSYQNQAQQYQQQYQQQSPQQLIQTWQGNNSNYEQNSSVGAPEIIDVLQNLSSTWGSQGETNNQTEENAPLNFESDSVTQIPVPEVNVVVEYPEPYNQNNGYNNPPPTPTPTPTPTPYNNNQQNSNQYDGQSQNQQAQTDQNQGQNNYQNNLVAQIEQTNVGYNSPAQTKATTMNYQNNNNNNYGNNNNQYSNNNNNYQAASTPFDSTTIDSFADAVISIANNQQDQTIYNSPQNNQNNYIVQESAVQNSESPAPIMPMPPSLSQTGQAAQQSAYSQAQSVYSVDSNSGGGYSQQQSQASPSPSSFPFPFPITADAVRIPSSAPPPSFGGSFSPVPLPPGAISVPTTTLPPSLIQSMSGLGTSFPSPQPSPTPAPSPDDRPRATYSTSGCEGRSDKPGPGTRCGCSNVVPSGYCACAQVFFMEICEDPDIATSTAEVPRGYCDVTCNRCECCPSVYEQAKNFNLTTFVEILDTISLVAGGGAGGGRSITDSLKNPSHTATVFIPTDEAFRILYEENLGQTKAEFLGKAPPLFQLVSTHVLISLYAATAEGLVNGELGTTLATQLPTAYLTLLNTDETIAGLEIQAPGSSARILNPDVNGCQSVIHVIDQVLLPYEPENKYG